MVEKTRNPPAKEKKDLMDPALLPKLREHNRSNGRELKKAERLNPQQRVERLDQVSRELDQAKREGRI